MNRLARRFQPAYLFGSAAILLMFVMVPPAWAKQKEMEPCNCDPPEACYPPDGCEYIYPAGDPHVAIAGGAKLADIDASHHGIICQDPNYAYLCTEGPCTYSRFPDCVLETFPADLDITIVGDPNGPLAGLSRDISFPGGTVKVERAGLDPNSVAASGIKMNMTNMSVSIDPNDGDPWFESLTLEAGQENGLIASLGWSEYYPVGLCSDNPRRPCENDSDCFGVGATCVPMTGFYNEYRVKYRISWVGAAGGPLDGLSDVSEGEVLMATGVPARPVTDTPTLSRWGMAALIVILVTAGLLMMRRRSLGRSQAAG